MDVAVPRRAGNATAAKIIHTRWVTSPAGGSARASSPPPQCGEQRVLRDRFECNLVGI